MKYLLPLLLLTACDKQCIEAHPVRTHKDMYFSWEKDADGQMQQVFHPSNDEQITVCDKYE